MTHYIIHTSQENWLQKALECYRDKLKFDLVDDAGVGLSSADLKSAVKLIQKAKNQGQVGMKGIATILTSFGLSSAGIWLVMAAIIDPEPTSKLSILLAGGIALIALGGLSILRALGMTWKVSANSPLATFTVEPK